MRKELWATNHLGWDIQRYSDETGWVPINKEPFDTKVDAYLEMEQYNPTPTNPLRVYEALS